VIKARHRATGRPVAIKRLGAVLGGHAALLREAQLLEASARDNPFVAGFRGLARNPATMALCLVMEFVGPSLDDLLSQCPSAGSSSPPLPEATVRTAMWQLLSGAAKMHERRVVHRDIKPSNILVGCADRSVVKICDFGLAMSMDERPPYDQAGTLCYMAPEMLLEKPDYDERVDAWSLGCVMAELINGCSPFEGLDDSEEEQLCAIFDVLGVPDDTTWPWFSSTAFGAEIPEPERQLRKCSLLRCKFPESKLSQEGFDVLSGLLTCNPDKRLTAAAALKRPWFLQDGRAAAAAGQET
jgi:cell division cycle 2-like protein